MDKRIAVRYCSKTKFSNTKRIAEAIAKGAKVDAVSIKDEPTLAEYVDVMFLGGAPYANIMAPELREYAENLSKDMVGEVYLFTTSNWSRRTIYALRKILRKNGIKVHTAYFYAHMLRVEKRLPAAERFGTKAF